MKRHLRESNLIEGIDDAAADADAAYAWDWFVATAFEGVVEAHIRQLQHLLTSHQTDLDVHERGAYRRVQVYVGNHVPPPAYAVPGLMEAFVAEFEDMDPIDAHVRFETIHPFVDGNGRTGRILLWWHQLRRGEVPTLFLNDEKWQKYYPLFSRER